MDNSVPGSKTKIKISSFRGEKNRARIPWYLIVHGRTDLGRKKWYISEAGVVSARLHRRFLAWDGKLKNPWPASNHAIHSTNRLSILSSYLTDKRRKEEKKRREQRFCEASSPFSRNKLNFARVQENEEKWKKGCGERVLEWNRVTIYFYLGRSTGRYCFLLDVEGLGYRWELSKYRKETRGKGKGRQILEEIERKTRGAVTPEESSKCTSSSYPREALRRFTASRLCPLFCTELLKVTYDERLLLWARQASCSWKLQAAS